jgi:hypothetical protein
MRIEERNYFKVSQGGKSGFSIVSKQIIDENSNKRWR